MYSKCGAYFLFLGNLINTVMPPSMFCMRIGQWANLKGTIKYITLLINLDQAFLRGQASVPQATINRCINQERIVSDVLQIPCYMYDKTNASCNKSGQAMLNFKNFRLNTVVDASSLTLND